MAYESLKLSITKEDGAGVRLDAFLARKIPTISRAYLQKKIVAGEVRINQKSSRKGYVLKVGDTLEVGKLLEKRERLPEANANLPITVLFKDEHLAVVEKPAGIPTHPVREEQTDTLTNWWIAQEPRVLDFAEDPFRAGIVHRLDTDTSGLIIVACTAESLAGLQAQFRRREVHKEYAAIVSGNAPEKLVIEMPLAHDPKNKRRMRALTDEKKAVELKARAARTEFWRESQFPGYALLRVRTYTGRMHQVRVHLAAIGLPLLGDRIYKSVLQSAQTSSAAKIKIDAPRHCLHAMYLRFQHPVTQEIVEFKSSLPEDMSLVVQQLREL